jgi:hypothetical protein
VKTAIDGIGGTAWRAGFLDAPGRRFAPPLLGVLAQTRLCDVLFRLTGQPRGRCRFAQAARQWQCP